MLIICIVAAQVELANEAIQIRFELDRLFKSRVMAILFEHKPRE